MCNPLTKTKKELCDLLSDVTYRLDIFDGDELIDQGSGVCINASGDILTAAHVLSGKLPVKDRDLKDIRILAKSAKSQREEYHNLICGLSVKIPQFKEPITVDLALIRPIRRSSTKKFVKINGATVSHGEDVLMCGFSDEVALPLDFSQLIDYSHTDFKGIEEQAKKVIDSQFRLSMTKSGMVGRVYNITIGNNANEATVNGATFYIDNVMHSGASGGPVVDRQGNLVGVITQRAISTYSTEKYAGLQVPSGSAVAVTPMFIFDFLESKSNQFGFTVEYTCISAT